MKPHPDSLTTGDLTHFRQRLADGLVSQAYEELAERGYRYATLANGVVRGDTFSGRIALEFLQKTAEAQNRPLSPDAVDAIRLALAHAYLDALSSQVRSTGALVIRDVLADETWNFHSQVFRDRGLGPDAWTLNQPFLAMEAEAREMYWSAVLDGAGDFAREVLLGFAIDLLMKRTALDLLEPEEAEAAWQWLHRLHNLDTYRIAVEAAGSQVERLADILPAALPGQKQGALAASAVKRILDAAAAASLDESLTAPLSAWANRVMRSPDRSQSIDDANAT